MLSKQDLLNKGFQHFAERNYEKAVHFFRKAIERDESFFRAYSALSETLNRMGKIDEAIPVVHRWISLEGHDPMAHSLLSRLYVQKGMFFEAEKEMALANNPIAKD